MSAAEHPDHYGGGDNPHETWNCLDAWPTTQGDPLLWNAAKYISRAGLKGDIITDLEKAVQYIQRRIAQLKAARAAGMAEADDASPRLVR